MSEEEFIIINRSNIPDITTINKKNAQLYINKISTTFDENSPKYNAENRIQEITDIINTAVETIGDPSVDDIYTSFVNIFNNNILLKESTIDKYPI
ncbi:MAG: hypothetical protein KDH96_11910, partial [Candidatus Riesia sp.]|nr:hypothetical protein [Candidatus Riesia sp.]